MTQTLTILGMGNGKWEIIDFISKTTLDEVKRDFEIFSPKLSTSSLDFFSRCFAFCMKVFF